MSLLATSCFPLDELLRKEEDEGAAVAVCLPPDPNGDSTSLLHRPNERGSSVCVCVCEYRKVLGMLNLVPAGDGASVSSSWSCTGSREPCDTSMNR